MLEQQTVDDLRLGVIRNLRIVALCLNEVLVDNLHDKRCESLHEHSLTRFEPAPNFEKGNELATQIAAFRMVVLEKAQELWRDEVSELADDSLVVFAQCSEGLHWQLNTF